MSKNHMIKQLDARWRPEWEDRTDLRPVRDTMRVVVAKSEAVASKREELAASGKLTPKGLADAVSDFARTSKAMTWARVAMHEADKASANVENQRKALAAPKIDRSDIAAAILRSDMRSYLRSLGSGERIGVVIGNPDLLPAVLEGPAVLSGFTEAQRVEATRHVVEATNAAAITAFEDTEEAIALARSTVSIALSDVKSAIGLDGSPREFDRWFAAATAPVDEAIRTEKNGGERVMNRIDKL